MVTSGETAEKKCQCVLEDFVKKEHAVEMMASIGDVLLQDASIQQYVMRSELVNAYWNKYPEAEALLPRRKDRIRAETKALGGTRTVAKRPVDDISSRGLWWLSRYRQHPPHLWGVSRNVGCRRWAPSAWQAFMKLERSWLDPRNKLAR